MRDGNGADATIAHSPNQIIRKIRMVILQYSFFCLPAIPDHLLPEQLYFTLDLDIQIKRKVSREGRLLVAGLPAVNNQGSYINSASRGTSVVVECDVIGASFSCAPGNRCFERIAMCS